MTHRRPRRPHRRLRQQRRHRRQPQHRLRHSRLRRRLLHHQKQLGRRLRRRRLLLHARRLPQSQRHRSSRRQLLQQKLNTATHHQKHKGSESSSPPKPPPNRRGITVVQVSVVATLRRHSSVITSSRPRRTVVDSHSYRLSDPDPGRPRGQVAQTQNRNRVRPPGIIESGHRITFLVSLLFAKPSSSLAPEQDSSPAQHRCNHPGHHGPLKLLLRLRRHQPRHNGSLIRSNHARRPRQCLRIPRSLSLRRPSRRTHRRLRRRHRSRRHAATRRSPHRRLGPPHTGIVAACAPSLARVFFRSIQGLHELLAQGFVIAATDYPGLGTAGRILISSASAKAAPSSTPSASRAKSPAPATEKSSPFGATLKEARPLSSPASSLTTTHPNSNSSASPQPLPLPTSPRFSPPISTPTAAATSPP